MTGVVVPEIPENFYYRHEYENFVNFFNETGWNNIEAFFEFR